MSVGRPNGNEFISPEIYISNQVKIEQARKLLEDMEKKNEIGLQKFTERERQQQAAEMQLLKQKEELQRKIQEGLEAQRLIEELERRQSAPLSEMSEIGGARIEEVRDNTQSMPPALPDIRVAGAQSSNTMPQYQDQTTEQPQQLVNHPAQMHAYTSSITAPLAGPPEYPQNSSLPTYPSIQYGLYNGSRYTASSTQQPYGSHATPNFYTQAAMTSWYPAQPRDSVGQSVPSQQVSFAPTAAGSSSNHTYQGQQHIAIPNTTMYQPAAGPSSSFNEYPRHTNTSSSSATASSNMDQSSSSKIHSTAEKPQVLQLPPPQLVNSRFVDNHGVPFIALTDEQVLGLRRQIDNWRRQAPSGTIDKLHEMLYLHKDRAPEPKTWIYVPLVPGGDRYAKTSEIDKFFNILLENARQTRRASAAQPAAQPTASNRHVPGAKSIVIPTAPIAKQHRQSRKNRPVSTPNTINSASSSTTMATAQLPPKSDVTPSGSTRNLPLPSLVDKKHLSQNVLFALGKRSRASTDSSASGKPSKKRAPNVAATNEKPAVTSVSSGPAVEVGSANPSEVSGPSIATSTSNIPSTPPLVQVPATQPNNDSSHSISTLSVNATSKVSHQQFTTPTSVSGVNLIPQQKPVTIKIPSTAKPASVAGPFSSTVSDPELLPGISNVTPAPAGEGSGQRKAPSVVNTAIVLQNQLAQPAAAATGSANGKTKAPATISAPFNPYLPLLSLHEPYGLQASAASSSSISQVGSFSYNDISRSQSSFLQPSTSKSQSNKQKEPLFLPSSSPERGPSRGAIKPEGGESSRLPKNGKKENRAYVLVPEPPEYLVRYRQRTGYRAGPQSDTEVTRQMMQSLRTGTSSVSTSVVGEEDAADELRHESSIEEDNTEQQAIDLACSRLQPLTCRWNGCNVDLNSINALIQHLEQHKPFSSSNDQFFTCRWSQCGRRCRYNEKHLEKHALLSLKCAFKDCDEFYRSGSRLLKHYTEKHTTSELKPSAEFSRPNLDTPPPVPGTLPAYLFVTKMAKPATITPERHEVLCRWVVQNIVNSDQEKPTRMRARKTAKNAKPRTVAPGHDYEFITARSTRYSSYLSQAVDLPLADLDSANISRMVDAGLTLWCPDEESDHEQDDVWDSPPPTSSTEPDVKEEMNDAVSLDDDHHQEEQSSDEDAVEVMLTGQ